MDDLISCCRELKEASISCCRTVDVTINWFSDPFFLADEQAAAKQVKLFRRTISITLNRLGPACRRWDYCKRLSHVLEVLNCVRDVTLAPITVGPTSYATAHEAARAFAEATAAAMSATDADNDVALCIAVKHRLAGLGYKNLRSRIESEFYAVVASQLPHRPNEVNLAPVDVDSQFEAPCDESEYLPKTDLIDIFGLPCRPVETFLANHPEVRTLRPPTRAGKPHPRRLKIHVLDFVEALRKDNYLINSCAVQQRLERSLDRPEINKALLDSAMAMLLGTFSSVVPQTATLTGT